MGRRSRRQFSRRSLFKGINGTKMSRDSMDRMVWEQGWKTSSGFTLAPVQSSCVSLRSRLSHDSTLATCGASRTPPKELLARSISPKNTMTSLGSVPAASSASTKDASRRPKDDCAFKLTPLELSHGQLRSRSNNFHAYNPTLQQSLIAPSN